MNPKDVAPVLFPFLMLAGSVVRGAPPPAEVFGAIPQVEDVTLSPNGNLLAWHDERGAKPAVVIFDLASRKFTGGTTLDEFATFRELQWADDETLLVEVSAPLKYRGETRNSAHYTQFRTFAMDADGGNARMLLMTGNRSLVTGADLLAPRTSRPRTVIMATWDYSDSSAEMETGSRLKGGRSDSGWIAQLFAVDTRTGKGSHLESGTSFTDQWIVDGTGQIVARSEWNPGTEVYSVLARRGRSWSEILRLQHDGDRALYGLSADGKAVIASDEAAGGRRILVTLPLDGSAGGSVLDDAPADITGVIRDPLTDTMVGVSLGGLEPSSRYFDADAERRQRTVAAPFPGKQVSIRGRSANGQRVLAEVSAPAAPPTYYVVDLEAHKAEIVGEEYPQLAGVTLGEVRPITYKARDGAAVPAYLTLPPGGDGKNLPLVVLPHGGPASRDDFAFDWWAQFLATRGYAVLQPQFRGSTGFGYEWRDAGYGQWGRLMQDDVTDGLKAMIEQGIADAGRVCIVGASYGGYAALAGAAFTPDLYRCAVSVNGVSDLPGMIGYAQKSSGEESDALAYWRDHIGNPADPLVIENSPVRAAAGIKVPVLLLHSTGDTVVPPSQSDVMAQALGKAGKPFKLVRLEGDDHWLSRSATRVKMLKEIERFLAENLGT